MILVNHKLKRSYIVEEIYFDGFSVKSFTFASEEDKDNFYDEKFFGAREIKYPILNIERRVVPCFEQGYSFSNEKIKELSEIKSEKEFAERYFPDFEIENDEYAERSYFSPETI